MGQKSNIITLRQSYLNKISYYNDNFIIYNILFCKYLKLFFKKYGILVLDQNFCIINNIVKLNLSIFFTKKKINSIKKKKIIKIKNKNFSKNFYKILSKIIKVFRLNILHIKFLILNNKIHKKTLKKTYNYFKKYSKILFEKRFYIFIDFLKIVSLFYAQQINVNSILMCLGQIFYILHKKKHTKYIDFLNSLFSFFYYNKKHTSIKGIKFILNGKILGKTRASSNIIKIGNISVQNFKENITFFKSHTYTKYGAFGFKIWICT